MARRSLVLGSGSYLPERIVDNNELSKKVDTSDEWIRSRSGIRQRHMAAEGELTSDLALAAARAALDHAGVSVAELDMIVLATTTPDETFPATAVRVQYELGMKRGAAFDIQAVCSGFIYALSVADNMIKGGQAETILVIGADTMTRILDWQDRATCVLFGDGAGAVVIRAATDEDHGDRGILSTHLHSDGRYHDCLYADGGPSSTGNVGFLRMQGKEVFRHAVVNLAGVVVETMQANGLSIADLDWLVPHQANKRILDGTARKLKLPLEKIVVTVDAHANTSAASIPLALDQAVADGRIRPGHLVLMEAMGGGFTWGSALVRW